MRFVVLPQYLCKANKENHENSSSGPTESRSKSERRTSRLRWPLKRKIRWAALNRQFCYTFFLMFRVYKIKFMEWNINKINPYCWIFILDFVLLLKMLWSPHKFGGNILIRSRQFPLPFLDLPHTKSLTFLSVQQTQLMTLRHGVFVLTHHITELIPATYGDFARNANRILQSSFLATSVSNYWPLSPPPRIIYKYRGWLFRGYPYSQDAEQTGCIPCYRVHLHWMHSVPNVTAECRGCGYKPAVPAMGTLTETRKKCTVVPVRNWLSTALRRRMGEWMYN
jgi:hypothetical protein